MKILPTTKMTLFAILVSYVPTISFAAQDIQVLTNLSVDVNTLDIEVKETFSGSGNVTWDGSKETRTISSDASSSTLGVTVIKDRFNIGLTALISGSDPAVAEGDIVLGDGTRITNAVGADITRNSYSLLGGYRITDMWSAYAGYTSSAIQAGSTFTLEDNGPYIGGKFIYRTSASTSLSFNLAYSFLSSTIDLKTNTLLNSYQVEGDTDGFGLGATWLYSLDRGRSFYVRVKYTKLKFDGTESGVSPALSTTGTSHVTVDQTQTVISLGMGF